MKLYPPGFNWEAAEKCLSAAWPSTIGLQWTLTVSRQLVRLGDLENLAFLSAFVNRFSS